MTDCSSQQHFHHCGDFPLGSGEVIIDMCISYVVHGQANADGSNVIIVLPSIAGDAHRLDFLIGPQLAFDPRQYCIIGIDSIGNGRSSSPSNSKTQGAMLFPRFTISDMVSAQYLLLQHLQLPGVLAIAGASMGGMQALQWAVDYPDFMQALITLVPLAKTPAWTQAINETSRKILMADAHWQQGNYQSPPRKGLSAWANFMCTVACYSPACINQMFAEQETLFDWMQQQEQECCETLDANNWIYQSWAYDAHNVAVNFCNKSGNVTASLQSIKAKTLIIGPELDLYNPSQDQQSLAQWIPGSRYIQSPSNRGHMSSHVGCEEDIKFNNHVIAEFLQQITMPPAQ